MGDELLTDQAGPWDAGQAKAPIPMDKLRNLGLAFIALGFVEGAWAAFCVFGGAALGLAGFIDDAAMLPMWVLSAVYGLLALWNFAVAALHVYAGTQLRKGRGLILAIAALVACLPQLILALYCSPITLGVMLFGILVLADEEARATLEET